MKTYQHLLKEKGIIQSMYRKGNSQDNAVIENSLDFKILNILYQKL